MSAERQRGLGRTAKAFVNPVSSLESAAAAELRVIDELISGNTESSAH